MEIYNITRGQLIAIWIFGLIAAFVALVDLDSYDSSGWSTVLLVLIPAALVFYSIGWRAHRKNHVVSSDLAHCTDCGNKISVGSKFCQSCGKKL